mgnify:CR=1 FL=1
MAEDVKLDRNLALEVVRVTEAAALAASKLMGRGDEKKADQAAVDAMRTSLNALAIDGTVVIGEGERDEAPMLYIGEKVGLGGAGMPKIDIALDPLEGTTITAKGGPNALAVIAMAEAGGFLNAPDVYMDKIAVGGGLPEGVVDLDATPAEKQMVLETVPLRERLDTVLRMLAHRIEVMKLSREIDERTKATMDDRQRKFMLNEQLKAIRKELGEDEGGSAEIEELKAAIEEAGMPEEVRKQADKE